MRPARLERATPLPDFMDAKEKLYPVFQGHGIGCHNRNTIVGWPRQNMHNFTKNDIPGRTVRLFLVEGKSTGMVMAEVMNWTGQVLAAPRSSLATLLNRDEARKPGVYLLLEDDAEQFAKPKIYIGESDNVAGRIKMHDYDKDFDRACIVTSKDANLTKGHVLYLESRLMEIAKAAGRATIVNAKASDNRSLPESDRADMEYFIQQLDIVLPIVAFDVLRSRLEPLRSSATDQQATRASTPLILSPRQAPGLAKAVESDGEVTVLAGSKALQEQYSQNAYAALRRQLIDDGRLTPSDDGSNYLMFTQDVAFKSPSAAASVILNRNSNGRWEWKLDDGSGRTLKEYQDAQLAEVDVSDDQS
ncbi:MAG: GIY-YIG nuclease family protein [Methyloceanibacter sp.]